MKRQKFGLSFSKGSCRVGGPRHIPQCCRFASPARLLSSLRRGVEGTDLKWLFLWLCHTARSLQTASPPASVPPCQLPRANLAAPHRPVAMERSLQSPHAACRMTPGPHALRVKRFFFGCTTCNVTKSCCYSQIQECLCLDCHREEVKPGVPLSCHALAKTTSKASRFEIASGPETLEDPWVVTKSKGLTILLVHLFVRYFPQRKSFSFLCFYCKLYAAKRKERKRPRRIDWGGGGQVDGFSTHNPFHCRF